MNFRNKLSLFIAILGLISLIVGSSYAIFTTNISEEKTQIISAGNVNIEMEEKTNGLQLSGLKAMSDVEGMLQDKYYEFNLKNISTTTVGYRITLINDDIALASYAGNILNDSYIKVGIEINNQKLGPYKLDEIGRVLYDSYMLVGGESNFKLRFWLDSTKANELSTMTGYSSFLKIKIVATQYFEQETTYVEANAPKMEENMIAIAYDEKSHNWYKADSNNIENSWYDYKNSIWANAATTKETSQNTTLTTLTGTISTCSNATCSRNDYKNAPIGTIIPMEDINTMWVWIPRFKYKIFNYNETGQTIVNSRMINIIFEEGLSTTGTVTCEEYIGEENNISEKCSDSKFGSVNDGFSTYTHPAFKFGDKDVTGFWIGKFEVSQNSNTSSLEIIPNVKALTNKSISNLFELTRNMELINNPYGFASNATGYQITGELTNDDNKIDTHMMKNMEWGAVAYLSQSIYGRCENDGCLDIYYNNSYELYTGRSSGADFDEIKTRKKMNPDYADSANFETRNTPEGYYTYDGKWAGSFNYEETYQEDLSLGYKASTTANIYGVYDMNGGAFEYVMANSRESTNSSFQVGSAGTWNETDKPNKKYYDEYSYATSNSNQYSKTNGKLGDANREIIRNENLLGWYANKSQTPATNIPYIGRGGSVRYMDTETDAYGLYGSMSFNGSANTSATTRVALVIE